MRTLPLFIEELRGILPAARQKSYLAMHSELIMIYWKIGQRVAAVELGGKSHSGYGYYIAKEFSDLLSKEFGKGFSMSNIWNFRQFYRAFPEKSISGAPGKELSWSHYRIIMRLANPAARQYYITAASEQNWTTRQLERHIKNIELAAPSPKSPLSPPPPKKVTFAELVQSTFQEILQNQKNQAC